MSDALKVRLISIGNTFVASFLLAVSTSIYQIGHIEWTTSFWISIAIAAVRFAFAEVMKTFIPQRLGGRKA
jgi:hypothetical protein